MEIISTTKAWIFNNFSDLYIKDSTTTLYITFFSLIQLYRFSYFLLFVLFQIGCIIKYLAQKTIYLVNIFIGTNLFMNRFDLRW